MAARKRSPTGFTPEELEAIRLADEEIEREFVFADAAQRRESRELDRQARLAGMDAAARRIAAYQAAYREAHREEIAAYQAAYYEAHREEIAAQKAAYREAHREELRAKAREYARRRRAEQRRQKQIESTGGQKHVRV